MKIVLFTVVSIFVLAYSYASLCLMTSPIVEVFGWAVLSKPGIELYDGFVPILGLDQVAFFVLNNRKDDLSESISLGSFSLATVLSLYLDGEEADNESVLERSIAFAMFLIASGYDPQWCEYGGISSFDMIKKIGADNHKVKKFFYFINADTAECYQRPVN